MSITALPQPPTRSDPVNFNSRADAFLSALPTFATEANELQADVNAKQTAAAASASNAAAAELAANAAANVTAWVSGTTYAVGNVRYSPITFLSYRRKTAGAGTTDPSVDSTNWQLINGTGNVDLNSTQTLTNKTIGTGSTINGIPVANLVNTTEVQTITGAKTFSGVSVLSTSGSVANGYAGVFSIKNQSGGFGAATSIDAYVRNTVVGTIAFTDTGDGGCQVNIAYTPPGEPTLDRRDFSGLVIGADGIIRGKGFLPYSVPGGVGTYALLACVTGSGGLGAGTFISGSELRYSDADGGNGGTPSGTWMSLGAFTRNGGGGFKTTLWLRVS